MTMMVVSTRSPTPPLLSWPSMLLAGLGYSALNSCPILLPLLLLTPSFQEISDHMNANTT